MISYLPLIWVLIKKCLIYFVFKFKRLVYTFLSTKYFKFKTTYVS